MKTFPIPKKTISREDQIRERAYELYERRGKQDGNELEDWLKAEADILESDVEVAA